MIFFDQNPNSTCESKEHWNLNNPLLLLATGFGVGLIPVAPGTCGALLAVAISWLIVQMFGPIILTIFIVLFFFIGIWVSDYCIKRFEVNDPQQVVIDEIVAQSLVLLCVPLEIMTYLIGFLLFRVFDIFKPWPISWSERAIKGGLGIMVDDILAAIYTLPFLYLISYLIGY